MQKPVQITFRGMDTSRAVEESIRDHVEKLERYYDGIVSCRVVVEAPHRQHHQGNLFHVSIDIKVPGSEILVSRDKGDKHDHEDAHVAIRDAFLSARRRLEDFSRRQRGNVKLHEQAANATVAKTFPAQDYGFLVTPEGREIYFHRNSVLNQRLEELEIGTPVHFVEEIGEKGPQATTVRPI
jgi:cold shock CspA family protein